MRRYIESKDEFDEVDELPSLKRKTGAHKVAASHHGSDGGANESRGVQDAAAGEHYSVSVGKNHSGVKNTLISYFWFKLYLKTSVPLIYAWTLVEIFFASLPSTTFAIL